MVQIFSLNSCSLACNHTYDFIFFSSLTSLQSYNICIRRKWNTTELCVVFFSLFSLCILCLSLSLLRQCLHVFNKCHNHKQHSCHIFALFLFLLSCAPIYLVLYQYVCYFSFFLVLIIMVGHEFMVSHDVHAGSQFSFHFTWWRSSFEWSCHRCT